MGLCGQYRISYYPLHSGIRAHTQCAYHFFLVIDHKHIFSFRASFEPRHLLARQKSERSWSGRPRIARQCHAVGLGCTAVTKQAATQITFQNCSLQRRLPPMARGRRRGGVWLTAAASRPAPRRRLQRLPGTAACASRTSAWS